MDRWRRLRETYGGRWIVQVCRQVWSFGRDQLVGLILTILIFLCQLYAGLITRENVRANELWTIAYPYLILLGLYLVFEMVRAPFFLDRERGQKIAELTEKVAALQKEPADKGTWANRALAFLMSPEHRAQEEQTRAIRAQVRESQRAQVPDVFVIINKIAVSTSGERYSFEMALEITNGGADTRLQDWQLVFSLLNGERRNVNTFESGEIVPSVSAHQRRPVNFATYLEPIRRGAHIFGWLVCNVDQMMIQGARPELQVFDDLGNHVRVVWAPQPTGG